MTRRWSAPPAASRSILPRPFRTTAALAGESWDARIPVAGLVLYLVWRDQKPRTAKAAGIGALVAVGLSFFWYIIALAGGISFALL